MKSQKIILISAASFLIVPMVVSAQAMGSPGMGSGKMQMGPNNTSGWSLMNKQERDEHHNKMLSMKTHEECTAYMQQHHTQMMERAKEKGRPALMQPKRDACAPLLKK
jgi:hypothetical protein